MRLRELAFRFADGGLCRVALDSPQHAVRVPAGRAPATLRDALGVLLYGPDRYPTDLDPALLQAGLVFEAEGVPHKVLIEFATGRRVLSVGGRPSADPPDVVERRLATLLGLPDVAVFRACTLSTAGPQAVLPVVPPGLHRALVAHARDPGRLRAEVDAARPAAGGPVRPPLFTLLRGDLGVVGGVAAGAAATIAGMVANGGARLVALVGPFAYGYGAYRALRRLGAGPGAAAPPVRRPGDRAESEAAWRARVRHLEALDEHLRALEATFGARDAELFEAVLSRGEKRPDARVRARVEALLGRAPSPDRVARCLACLRSDQPGAVTAAWALAAALEEGAGFPLFWVAEGAIARPEVDWSGLYEALGAHPLVVFFAEPPPAAARPVGLEAGLGPTPAPRP